MYKAEICILTCIDPVDIDTLIGVAQLVSNKPQLQDLAADDVVGLVDIHIHFRVVDLILHPVTHHVRQVSAVDKVRKIL